MHEFYELKEMLMEEVKKIAKKGELTAGSLETVDKLLNSIKNACKIIMYDEYSEEGEYSQEGGMSSRNGGGSSYARGRGGNARRDSRGRYSSEGGYSNARGGGRGGSSRRSSYYSYDDGENEEKIEMLREMMQEVNSEEERRALQKIIRRMEQE
jgi:small nuclear ribonucleoprotein (snRNP)-like protein